MACMPISRHLGNFNTHVQFNRIEDKRHFSFLKRTVGGVLGEYGANVPKHVALGHSIANGPVPGLLRDMVESPALDQTNRLENAAQNRVPVSLTLTFLSRRTDCLVSCLCGKMFSNKKKKTKKNK